MTLVLPGGMIPPPSYTVTDEDLLTESRVTEYRFYLLDHSENVLGELTSVEPGGSISWNAESSIKAGGSIVVRDEGQVIDWLSVRIQIVATLQGDEPTAITVPCGIYLPAAPEEAWSSIGRAWKVELLDKLSILDQNVVTVGGLAASYTVPLGTNILTTVAALIQSTGEATPAIGPGTEVVGGCDLFWDVGTSRLRIINDLLGSANYLSLWTDGSGQFQVTKYVPPVLRAPVYTSFGAFSVTEESVMAADWTRSRDIYAIPNRYVCVGQATATNPALTSTATNTDPTSPFSYANRGNRWITAVETNVTAVDQPTLDAYARRKLSAATSVAGEIKAKHLLLPNLLINTVIRFVNPDAGLDILCTVKGTTIPLDPVALCDSTLREVLMSEQ